MPRSLKRSSFMLLCAAALAGAGLSSGCAETATAAGAAQTAQVAADVLGSIPAWVQQAADAIQFNNSLSWGKPEAVVVTDTTYVLMYPTTAAQRRANKGVPRMIVIERSDAPADTL